MSLVNENGVPQICAQADPALPGLAAAMDVLEKWHVALGRPTAETPVVPDLHASGAAKSSCFAMIYSWQG